MTFCAADEQSITRLSIKLPACRILTLALNSGWHAYEISQVFRDPKAYGNTNIEACVSVGIKKHFKWIYNHFWVRDPEGEIS